MDFPMFFDVFVDFHWFFSFYAHFWWALDLLKSCLKAVGPGDRGLQQAERLQRGAQGANRSAAQRAAALRPCLQD